MAKNKKSGQKEDKTKDSKQKKKGSGKVRGFFTNLRSELKRVTWPGKKEVRETTGLVIAIVIAVVIFIALIDGVMVWLLDLAGFNVATPQTEPSIESTVDETETTELTVEIDESSEGSEAEEGSETESSASETEESSAADDE